MPDETSIPVQICLTSDAELPRYETAGAAGADLRCSEEVTLEPLERRLVSTGIRIAVPFGYEAQVRPRSGLAIRHGVSLVNTPGTIDSDYRGELKVIMINLGSEPVTFSKGERIAQLVICPVLRASFQVVENLDDTDRGEGGFGSTGT